MKIERYSDLPALTNISRKDDSEQYLGRHYVKITGDITLTKWERLAAGIKAVALTIITLIIGLLFQTIRQPWVEFYSGKRNVIINVYADTLPENNKPKKADHMRPETWVIVPLPNKAQVQAPNNVESKPSVIPPAPKKIEGKQPSEWSEKEKDDLKIVTKAISQNGLAYQYVSDRLKNDCSFTVSALKTSTAIYPFIPEKIKKSEEFIIQVIQLIKENTMFIDANRNSNNNEISKLVDLKLNDKYTMLRQIVVVHKLTIQAVLNVINHIPDPKTAYDAMVDIAYTLEKHPRENLLEKVTGQKFCYFLQNSGFVFMMNENHFSVCTKLAKENVVTLNDLELLMDETNSNTLFAGLGLIPNFHLSPFGMHLEKCATPETRKLLAATFVSIANELDAIDETGSHYFPASKDQTLPFIITEGYEVYLGGFNYKKSGFKEVFDAISLSGSEDLVWLQTSERKSDVTTTFSKMAAAVSERDALSKLHEKMEPPKVPMVHIAPKYKFSQGFTLEDGDLSVLISIQERLGRVGDLVEKVKDGGKPDVKAILQIGLNISEALTKMSFNGFSHSDVKPANFLFKKDADGKIVEGILTDFGAKVDKLSRIFQGTPAYLPPEATDEDEDDSVIKSNTKVGIKLDAFGLGVSLIEMITGSNLTEPVLIPKLLLAKDNPDPAIKAAKEDVMQKIPTRVEYYRIQEQFNKSNNKNDKEVDNSVQNDIRLKIANIKKNNLLNDAEKKIAIDILIVCGKLMDLDAKKRISCGEAHEELKKIRRIE